MVQLASPTQCAPALIYLVLVVFAVIWQLRSGNYKGLIGSIIMYTVVTLLMLWMCGKGYDTAAWITLSIIVLLPLVFLLFIFVVLGKKRNQELADQNEKK